MIISRMTETRDRTADREWDDVIRIQRMAANNLISGQKLFAEIYGTGVDTNEINRAIEEVFGAAHDKFLEGESDEITVALPLHLVLAVTLLKGFRKKRGRPKRATQRRRALALAMRNAPEFIANNRALRLGKGDAREKAIEHLAKKFGIASNIIRNEMRSPKSKLRI